jgi:ankyrin repeat protein
MDTKLPPRPSLAQLRKQAKELKDSGQHPTLSKAQFALAQQYGFPSWPKLKLAVEQDALERMMIDGDYDGMRKLLKGSPKAATAISPDGYFPLHHAAELNDPVLIDILVENGAPLVQKWQDTAHTALSWAVTVGSFHTAVRLVQLGVKPDLFTASGMGLLDYVKLFWPNGKLLENPSSTGSSRFSDSGERLPRPPADSQDQVSDALYIACRHGRLETAEWLLDHGADIDWRGYSGATPLAWAYFSGNSDLCDLLIAKGASETMVDQSFKAPPKVFGLMVLAGWGFPGLLRERLTQQPDMVNAQGGYGTLLNAAVWNCNPEVVKILLEFGADKTLKNAAGLTPLELAKEKGFKELEELLTT